MSTESVEFKTFAGARVGLAPGPQMAANPRLFGALGEVPVKAKLQALLILLTSRFGERDVSALIDKLRALLALPDSALVAVLGLPEMRDLSRLLDAASLGTVDLPRIKTEMGKIALTSAPQTPYQVEIAVNGRPTASVDMRYVRSDPSQSLAAATPATAPAMAPAGFVNVEPGVSIVASAVTVSVMRAVEPVATPMLTTVAAPQVFAATLETVPAPTTAPAPVTIAPETFTPTTVTAAPETFAPPTMTAAPETFTPTIETFAPETVVPSAISTPEPTEPTQSPVEDEVPGTVTPDDDMNSVDNSGPRTDEPQGGQDNSSSSDSSSSNDADSTGSAASGQGGAEAGGDASTGGRETGGGNDSSSGGDGSGGGSASP
ncbi:hypothetical protein ASG82_08840 [Mycobacterium sp. Soil538]|nr:hypothetical protein ASG82_08840 [Mycobacterium sp. Soil538]